MKSIDRAFGVLACAAVVVTLTPLVTEWWIVDLTTHFRLQMLTAQGALLVFLTLRARWLWVVALLPAIVLNVSVLSPYWPRLDRSEPGPTLALMSVNLNATNRSHTRLSEIIRAETPDMILLIEFNAQWREGLAVIQDDYPYRIQIPRQDLFGLALYSKRPFTRQRSFQLETTTALDVSITHEGRSIRVIGVHLRPPTNQSWAAERDRQLGALASIAQTEPGPLIVIGDFNITPYSPRFAATFDPTDLTDARRERGPAYSWPAFFPILGIPIDLCLIDEHFVVAEHRLGPEFGSDHYPIIASVALE